MAHWNMVLVSQERLCCCLLHASLKPIICDPSGLTIDDGYCHLISRRLRKRREEKRAIWLMNRSILPPFLDRDLVDNNGHSGN